MTLLAEMYLTNHLCFDITQDLFNQDTSALAGLFSSGWLMEKLGLHVITQAFQPLVPVSVQSYTTLSMAVRAMNSSHRLRKEGPCQKGFSDWGLFNSTQFFGGKSWEQISACLIRLINGRGGSIPIKQYCALASASWGFVLFFSREL